MKTEQAARLARTTKGLKSFFQHIRISFWSLRWRLALSYLLVTVAALLVVELILVILLMNYFVNNIDLTPETLISNLRAEWTPQVQQFFSKEPPDVDGMRAYLEDVQGSVIGTKPLLILGNLELEMKAQDFLDFYYLLDDRTLVDVIPHDILSEEELGVQIPYNFLPGLERPLRAALDGVEDQNLLYEKVEPGNRIVGAIPVFRFESVESRTLPEGREPVLDVERKLVGVIVFMTKRFPWEFLPLSEVMAYIGRSLLIFTLFAGILGSIFGMMTANGLTKRFSNVSQAAHSWSRGDFSVVVRDTSVDEIGKLTYDLNSMAEQLENLLDRRLELSVLEERNRLARDLHDSVKQQAFAASAQLGAAKAHIQSNPEQALSHLNEADILIGKVRQELTDLIQELRPVAMKGKGLIAAVEDYAKDWCNRNEIEINIHVSGERSLPLNVEKSIFRIIQEALANVAWHSHANNVDLVFNFRSDFLLLTIRDDGEGFLINQPRKTGMGLKSMQERAELIGGELNIDSRLDLGTKIILKYSYQ
ncbi:sensor histidine kinase [Patescibacteria group bacterium]|nr:sensor histidine kinase [Patescibacteria group bacterium]